MRIAPLLLVSALLLPAVYEARGDVGFLEVGRTFEAPIADPRWPRFAASWREYDGDSHLDSAAAVALGGTFALVYGRPEAEEAPPAWELGLQAAMFGTFQPESPSQDLYNTDWQFGIYAAGRSGRLSGIARLWHQSSHLGDEFLLRTPGLVRINFEFESVDGLLAYDLTDWSRIYAGGGWIFDEHPSDYGNWIVQYGLEVHWPRPIWNGYAVPFAAVDVTHLAGRDWQGNISLMAGVELTDPATDGPTLRAAVEYYNGGNFNGQFFEESVQYVGVGLQLEL